MPVSSVTENIFKPKAHAGDMGILAALQRGTLDASGRPSERRAGLVIRHSLSLSMVVLNELGLNFEGSKVA